MAKIEEMNRWSFSKAWKFFSKNSFNRFIPETEKYVRSLPLCITEDLRGNKEARKKIQEVITKKTLIFIDGSSLNGKTTFAKRLTKHLNASLVDIDLLCKDWIDEELAKITNPYGYISFMNDVDRLTDVYILENLENIIKEKSKTGNVILVGCYMEVIYRAIIAKTLGQYFEQVVSIYCCAKSFGEVMKMLKKRDGEFGLSVENENQVLSEYNYSKRLLEYDGIMLGFGMTASFISDNSVSDLFA